MLFGVFFLATAFFLPAFAADLSLPLKRNLKDAYLSTLDRSETLGIQKELLAQATEINTQAQGAMLPTLTGTYNFLQQASPSSPTGSTIFPSNQNTAKITLSQPLFRGLSDFAALRQKKYLVGAQKQALLNAARTLFYDVSTAFYNVLSLERDAQNIQIEIDVNRKRLKELDSFVKIGRSQQTDVLTFRANVASLETQLEMTRGQVETARDVLAYFTGWNRDFVLTDTEKVPLNLEAVSAYLERIDDRPDVRSAAASVQANDEDRGIAFGKHLPSIDLLGNYYLVRPGVLSDVSWDFQLAVSIPLFQGGIVQSQVRQAESIARQNHLLLSQTRRLAEEEIRSFFNAVSADSKQLDKLRELILVSKKNADTQVKYYRNGLVTNLEVLQAFSTHQQAQKQLDHQLFTTKLDFTKLQAASGQRSELSIRVDSGSE